MSTSVGFSILIGVLILVGYLIWKNTSLGVPPPMKPRTPDPPDTTVARWLDAINSWNLTPISPQGIVPAPGEIFYYQQGAQYGQTFKERVYAGGNRALYVPLGHGLRYRVGGNRGSSQTVANFRWVSSGTVYVSNTRIVFKNANSPEVANAPYGTILAYDCYPDGLGIQVEGIGQMQFRTGDVVLGALFQKMIASRSSPKGP